MSNEFSIGSRVRVKTEQSKILKSVLSFAGKTGIIQKQVTTFARSYGDCFSVLLNSGKVENIFASDLELLPETANYSQTEFPNLYDIDQTGINRAKPQRAKKVKQPIDTECRQLSLFEVLRDWAEQQLKVLQNLYDHYLSYMLSLSFSKMSESKRIKTLAKFESKASLLSIEINQFGLMWGLL